MKILVTGAKGFVGKNLCHELRNRGYTDVYEYDVDSTAEELELYTSDCEFVFHLAGVNRPKQTEEFMQGNYGFTGELLEALKRNHNKVPVMLSSSTQAESDNPYGESKRMGERLLLDYQQETDAPVYIYRFTNLFGKWCRPNYNSVIATFCYNIARGEPIRVDALEKEINFCYIDDVLEELIGALTGDVHGEAPFCAVPVSHTVSLGRLAQLLKSFHDSRGDLSLPELQDPFVKKLHATYLSYLPEDRFSYPLKMNVDDRGSFTEFLRMSGQGQVSVNVAKPGIVKGQHWHHTKNEKFLVVSGQGVIRFRHIDSDQIVEYPVSGARLEVVDIPVGYTHNIENTGITDMVTVMWANEPFNPERPDTYFEKV